MTKVSSKIVSTVIRTTHEVKIPIGASDKEVAGLFNHLVKFAVATTGADVDEIMDSIEITKERFVFEESRTELGNNYHPMITESIQVID